MAVQIRKKYLKTCTLMRNNDCVYDSNVVVFLIDIELSKGFYV